MAGGEDRQTQRSTDLFRLGHIETSLTLRLVFKQPLRQTTGLLRSLTEMLQLDELPIPNYSTLSRRGQHLKASLKVKRAANQPPHLPSRQFGLKVHGEGEWLQRKHGAKCRRWRKLQSPWMRKPARWWRSS